MSEKQFLKVVNKKKKKNAYKLFAVDIDHNPNVL